MESYDIENQVSETVQRDALNFALKHLEFVLFYELDLKEKHANSSRFLKAFASIKKEAQMEVLKYSAYRKK